MYCFYRIEKDGKYYLDDGTKQYGMPFKSFDLMRSAIIPECDLIEVV